MTRAPGNPPDRTEPRPDIGGDGARPNTQIRATASGKAHSGAEIVIEERRPDSEPPISGRKLIHAPGSVVGGKYRLKKPLGSGGMGEVWVAHHLALDIDVAVKFIGEEGEEAGTGERLLEEARTTARLGHPSIVRALDFGHTEHGKPFIVLELLEGEDLAALLERQGSIPPERAVSILLPIAHALAVVHENQIVHRDVKPENVFLARAETGTLPKLLDFGIARKTGRVKRLTARDTALGTPDYMSPQQARGDATDASTDQWSFCVVLYEALVGGRPFEADNYNALLRTIIEQEPRSILERGVAEPELWNILARGLHKEPSGRYPSMRELGEALARWLLSRGISEDAAGTSLRRVWLKEDSVVTRLEDLRAQEARSEPRAAPRSNPAAAPSPGSNPLASSSPTSDDAHAVERIVVEPTPRVEHALLDAPLLEGGDDARNALDSAPRISEPEAALTALAELHRGGEPEERFRRAARIRSLTTFALLVAIVFGATFAILLGTGIVEF